MLNRQTLACRYTLVAIGGVVIIADHTPIGQSYFSPAGAAASWKLGMGLVGIGSTGLYKKILEKVGAALG